MDYTNPAEIRKMLTTRAAKRSFDKLNALGPRWVCDAEKDENGKVYLSPTIEIGGDSLLRSINGGYAKSFNIAVNMVMCALKRQAREPGAVVVTNAYRENRAEFTLDKDSCIFKPHQR